MKRVLAVLALCIAVATAACGTNDDPAVRAEDGATTPQDHNEADVAFAQGMIPHHDQAIEMSTMVIQRGDRDDVKAVAQRIADAQGPEIDLMREWLAEWGEEESPEGDMAGHDTSGMMSNAEMEQLQDASGPDLDRMFLEMMIRHHEGAISMAEDELENGQFPAALKLAETIINTQQAEIEEMQGLLDAP